MALGIEADVAASINSFRFNEAGLRHLLTGEDGPVFQDLARRAIRVEGQAKVNATRRPGPMVRTGRLRGSITHRLGRDAQGPYADIGSSVLYAPYVELGTSRMQAFPYLRPALEAARV